VSGKPPFQRHGIIRPACCRRVTCFVARRTSSASVIMTCAATRRTLHNQRHQCGCARRLNGSGGEIEGVEGLRRRPLRSRRRSAADGLLSARLNPQATLLPCALPVASGRCMSLSASGSSCRDRTATRARRASSVIAWVSSVSVRNPEHLDLHAAKHADALEGCGPMTRWAVSGFSRGDMIVLFLQRIVRSI
jgi:hypothetical protein